MLYVFVRIWKNGWHIESYSHKNTNGYVHLHIVHILYVYTYMYVLTVYARICMYLNKCPWEIHTNTNVYLQYVHVQTYIHIYTCIYDCIRAILTDTFIRTHTYNIYRYVHIHTIRTYTDDTYSYEQIHSINEPHKPDTYIYLCIPTYTINTNIYDIWRICK